VLNPDTDDQYQAQEHARAVARIILATLIAPERTAEEEAFELRSAALGVHQYRSLVIGTLGADDEAIQYAEKAFNRLYVAIHALKDQPHDKPELANDRKEIRKQAFEEAYDKVRGTNADLCKTPVAAYRLMMDALLKLKNG
jgi:hypothetical protein